jgi:hypothetical protein
MAAGPPTTGPEPLPAALLPWEGLHISHLGDSGGLFSRLKALGMRYRRRDPNRADDATSASPPLPKKEEEGEPAPLGEFASGGSLHVRRPLGGSPSR